LLYVERIFSSQRVIETLRRRNMLPDRLLACGDLELVKSLALRGIGAAVLPYRVAAYNVPAGALRVVDPALPHEVDTAYLMYRADLHRTRTALLVKDALLRRGRELDAKGELPCGVPRLGKG
jgi:DNA-binding transcriptional LysR family regulator